MQMVHLMQLEEQFNLQRTGNLKLGSTVTSLGTFTRATSKVTYE